MLDQGLFWTQASNKGTIPQQFPQSQVRPVFHITPQLKHTCQLAIHPENGSFSALLCYIHLKQSVFRLTLQYGHTYPRISELKFL
jgi:hypothetical protein